MPLDGTLDPAAVLESAPRLDDLGTEPVVLPGVEALQVFWEIDSAGADGLLPPALHPTSPPCVVVGFWSVPESPWGPFRLAQVRITARAATKPRGFAVAGFTDSPVAAEALAARWAYDLRVADVRCSAGHIGVRGVVEAEGRVVLDVGLGRPEAISGSDVFFTATMQAARTPRGDRLVQVDPDYTFHRAERGRPRIDVLDVGSGGIRPTWPVSATYAACDIELPRLRYLCLLDEPAARGTERIE